MENACNACRLRIQPNYIKYCYLQWKYSQPWFHGELFFLKSTDHLNNHSKHIFMFCVTSCIRNQWLKTCVEFFNSGGASITQNPVTPLTFITVDDLIQQTLDSMRVKRPQKSSTNYSSSSWIVDHEILRSRLVNRLHFHAIYIMEMCVSCDQKDFPDDS